jgi:hypothetical protein
MDELLKQVTATTGMSAEQVKPVVDSVLGFLKEKLPGGLGGHIDALLSGGGNLGDVAKNLGGLFGQKAE